MNSTEDVDEWSERWESHITELERMRYTAVTNEESERVAELIKELRVVKDVIAEDWREQKEQEAEQ